MAGRVLAIGDIHGYSAALDAIVHACAPDASDTVVTLGDYVDRGPDSRGVLERLIELADRCQLVPLLGNHDEMLMRILDGRRYLLRDWLAFGGEATLASYDGGSLEAIPESHAAFLNQCRPFYETERHFFVHGSYVARLPLKKQPPEVLRWQAVRDEPPRPHRSGKIAIVGHTAQRSGEVLDLGYLKCIDTYIYGNGWLTALDVESGQIWQADGQGNMRK